MCATHAQFEEARSVARALDLLSRSNLQCYQCHRISKGKFRTFGGVLLFAGIATLISEPCLSPSQNAAVGVMGKANKKGKESCVLIQQ